MNFLVKNDNNVKGIYNFANIVFDYFSYHNNNYNFRGPLSEIIGLFFIYFYEEDLLLITVEDNKICFFVKKDNINYQKHIFDIEDLEYGAKIINIHNNKQLQELSDGILC